MLHIGDLTHVDMTRLFDRGSDKFASQQREWFQWSPVISPFVAEFNSNLTALKFSTLFGTGGQSQLVADGLALDTAGNIYVAGSVNSPPAPSSATVGTAVNLTATVAEVGSSSVPTGTVTFKDGTTSLGR
jgi:beta-propeller repeat-containing protein